MKERKYKIRPINKFFIIWLLIILVLFAVIAGSTSYIVRKESIMRQCEAVMQDIYDLYYGKVTSFSDIYIPVYASKENENIMRSYFNRSGERIPNATERAKLVSLLRKMIAQDAAVSFIALYDPEASHNYYFSANGNSLKEIWPDLLAYSDDNGSRMQLLGRYVWKDDNGSVKNAFLIKGGSLVGSGSGSVIVGYNADIFEQLIDRNQAESLVSFVLVNENGVIFDSEEKRYSENFQPDWLGEESAYHRDPSENVWFTGVMRNHSWGITAAYIMPWWQIIRESSSVSGLILLILFLFSFFALVLYLHSTRQIFHKVREIQNGLAMIGNNRLEYRLQVTDVNDEFDEISKNVNAMTERLKESIENEYQMRLRQTRSELSQIQARFNPHFLYNSLEVIRGNLFRNGDVENADYIEKLSRIFRNLTDASPVISIREEVSFCSLYMVLLQLRFRDAVDIIYDIDTDLQECGILAHLIQPAIENYFVHGLSETEKYHAMDITCHPAEENGVCIVISDNGMGLSRERLEEINLQLRNADGGGRGYGLTSIANRIRLFYGEQYGILLEHNRPSGVRVIITIPRMSVEEHQRKLGIFPQDQTQRDSGSL